jgi:4-hydroxy-4-methyl-2-oxoglutarate aldolase
LQIKENPVAEQFIAHRPELPQHLVDAFRKQAAATVYEAASKAGAMDHLIRPVTPGLKLCGRAITVCCQPGDNLTLHAAIAMAKPGDVIVADVGGYLEAGHWGEIMTVAAQAKKIAGLVTNGAVRDIEPNTRRGFPIFAAGVCMKGTVKESPGYINHPILCGGAHVAPGDLVLGDDDGVVVIAHARAEEILAASIAREEKEADVMKRLEQGELTLDLLGFRKALERKNLKV